MSLTTTNRAPLKPRHSLKPADLLLVGRLSVEIPWRPHEEPWLAIRVWCPYCKATHLHGWDERLNRADSVSHRIAHCPKDERRVIEDYWIGPDPSHAEHNRAALAEFAKAHARWAAKRAGGDGASLAPVGSATPTAAVEGLF